LFFQENNQKKAGDDKEKIYNKRKVKCILRQRSDKYVGRIFDSTRIGKMMKGYQ